MRGATFTLTTGLVAERPGGTTPKDVAAALGWRQQDGTPDGKKAGVYLGRLADAGRISRTGRGVYTCVESVESVETEEFGQVPAFPDFNTFNRYNTGSEGSTTDAQSVQSVQLVQSEQPPRRCADCGQPMIDAGDGCTTHPNCGSAA